MLTIQDYFTGAPVTVYIGESPADWQAQNDINEINDQLNRFLEWQDCEQGWHSEWYYSCQCSGLSAEPKGYSTWYDLRPVPMVERDMQLWCDYDIRAAWMRHYYRLQGLADLLEHYEDMRYAIDYVDASDEAYDEVYCPFESMACRIADLYGNAFHDAIQDVCQAAQKVMEACCDYAYSTEAAEEWLAAQDFEDDLDLDDDLEELVNEVAADILAGMTAAYESYAA